jgi:hypothetical protein
MRKIGFEALVAMLLVGVGVLALAPRYHHLTAHQKHIALAALVIAAITLEVLTRAAPAAVRRARAGRRQQVRGSWQ